MWAAWDERLGEKVALKFLPALLCWDAAAIAALRAETQRSRRLSHPHVVRVHDLHESEDGIALAMEFVEGETLTSWRMRRAGGVVSPAEIMPWLAGLCAALDYAHREAGIVHRDLKPGNLLIDQNGQVKVADFGVSCLVAETMARVSSTVSGGTLAYMSPQQLWGEPASPQDDIYALGATLYELLGGEAPFVRGNLLLQVPHRLPPSLNLRRSQIRPDSEPVSEAWETAIMACLSKSAHRRPRSATALYEEIAGTAGVPSRSVGRIGTGWRMGILGGVTATALVVAALWGDRGPRDPQLSDDAAMVRAIGTPAPVIPRVDSDAETVVSSLSAPIAEIAASRNVHGALAQAMVGHWPLDGLLLDYCGGKRDATGYKVDWAADRFGGEGDAALLDNGAQIRMPLQRGLVGADGVVGTVGLWAKVPHGSAGLMTLVPDRDGEVELAVRVEAGRIYLEASEFKHRALISFSAAETLRSAQWVHVALVFEGERLVLWLDGHQVIAGEIPERRMLSRDVDYTLQLGGTAAQSEGRNACLVDDVRVWRAPLGESGVLTLAEEDFRPLPSVQYAPAMAWPWQDGWIYQPTQHSYSDAADLSRAVKAEFGDAAALADWRDLARAAGPLPVLWSELAGIDDHDGDGGLVSRGGETRFLGPRSYFLSRFNAGVPAYYLAHALVGHGALVLGSWQNRFLPILARLPAGDRYRVGDWQPQASSPVATHHVRADQLAVVGRRGSDANAPVDQRVWIVNLGDRFSMSGGVALTLQSGLEAKLEPSSQRGDWRLFLVRAGGGVAPEQHLELANREVTWVVVQSLHRVYQVVLNRSETEVLAELLVTDLPAALRPPEAWVLELPSTEADTVAGQVRRLTQVTRYAATAVSRRETGGD